MTFDRDLNGLRIGLAVLLVALHVTARADFAPIPVTGWIFNDDWGYTKRPQPTQASAAFEYCNGWYGGPPAPGYPQHIEYSSYYWYGPAWQCSANSYVQDRLLVWVTRSVCPVGSTLSGSVCTCNSGRQKPTGDGCYQSDVTDIDRTQPKQCEECEARQQRAYAGFGNPIFPLRGAKRERVPLDVTIGGTRLELTYDSQAQQGLPELGTLWQSSLHRRLVLTPGSVGARVLRGDGRAVTFRWQAGQYVQEGGGNDSLVNVSGGLRFFDAQAEIFETYDLKGFIKTLSDTAGNTLAFTYNGAATPAYPAGQLIKVQDNVGRTVHFEYQVPNGASDTDFRLQAVIAADGSRTSFDYTLAGNLASVKWPDGHSRQFLYENASFPGALTGILDESGARYATFEYDTQGRAIATEHAGGADRYSVTYTSPPGTVVVEVQDAANLTVHRYRNAVAPEGTSITRPNGQVDQVSATPVLGGIRPTGNSQSAGSGSSAAHEALNYDARGNVVSRDDFAGQRGCFAYDAQDRETVRVEGLAVTASCATVLPANSALPVGARKITTSWHPDWRKPVQVLDPFRRTTYVYHGQPDPFNGNAPANCTTAAAAPNGKPIPVLCKKVEEALLATGAADPGSPARTLAFNYDASAHLTSSTDPNGRQVTRTYYQDTSYSGTDPQPQDPDFDSVALLLKGEGPNNAAQIDDSSRLHRRLVTVGNAKNSTTQSLFGGSALAFDGTGDYVKVPFTSDLAVGSRDFTIELFLFKNGNNANSSRIWHPNGDVYTDVSLDLDANGAFSVSLSISGVNWTYRSPAIPLPNGQWYHLAVVRSGGSVFAFVNGVKYTVTTGLGSTALYPNTMDRVIGGQTGVDRALNGYIDSFRITLGKARYVDTFSPPTVDFPAAGTTWGASAVGHRIGDLQAVSNAAGQVTLFNQFDAAGRVLQMTDSKGTVFTVTYTERGLIRTLAVAPPNGAARTTTYAYDPIGQRSAVTLPDGAMLTYVYDAAHRLTGITDGRGNSITYTLDASGNRIGEDVKDSTGALRRSIGRSFDALNRVQQTTGIVQ